jgi:hypothetical protein
MQRVTKPRKAKPEKKMTPQRKSMAHPNRQKVLFKPGNQLATVNKGQKRHKRYLTMGLIRTLAEEIERQKRDLKGQPVKDKNGKDVYEKVAKEITFYDALLKACTVDRNPAAFKMVVEMIEGKTPQPIDVRSQSVNITAKMSFAEASKAYLESIKRTSIEDAESYYDDEEEDE